VSSVNCDKQQIASFAICYWHLHIYWRADGLVGHAVNVGLPYVAYTALYGGGKVDRTEAV